MTKMEILLKITPAVSIVRKLTPKMEEKHQNRQSLLGVIILAIKSVIYNIYILGIVLIDIFGIWNL